MKRWYAGMAWAGLLILMASLLLTGCPRGDHMGDGMKDGPRRTRNY